MYSSNSQPLTRSLATATNVSQLPAHEVSLASLPSIEGGNYKVDPYIEAAAELQASGKDAACIQLLALAHSSEGSNYEGSQRITVLCRMLFVKRPGLEFRRQALGAPQFLGDDRPFGPLSSDDPSFKKWPLEPIELAHGVPFAVVTGYLYEGFWDPTEAESYVRYCMTNCDWSAVHFAAMSKKQKEAALREFLSSPKWKPLIGSRERDYLTKQIE